MTGRRERQPRLDMCVDFHHESRCPVECEGAIIGLQMKVAGRKKAEEVGADEAQVNGHLRPAGVEKKARSGGNWRRAGAVSQRPAQGSLSTSQGSTPWTTSPDYLPLFG